MDLEDKLCVNKTLAGCGRMFSCRTLFVSVFFSPSSINAKLSAGTIWAPNPVNVCVKCLWTLPHGEGHEDADDTDEDRWRLQASGSVLTFSEWLLWLALLKSCLTVISCHQKILLFINIIIIGFLCRSELMYSAVEEGDTTQTSYPDTSYRHFCGTECVQSC